MHHFNCLYAMLEQIKLMNYVIVMYNGEKLWNRLPVSIKSIEDKDNFKKK